MLNVLYLSGLCICSMYVQIFLNSLFLKLYVALERKSVLISFAVLLWIGGGRDVLQQIYNT